MGVRLGSICMGYVGMNLIKCVAPSGSTFPITVERVKYRLEVGTIKIPRRNKDTFGMCHQAFVYNVL